MFSLFLEGYAKKKKNKTENKKVEILKQFVCIWQNII